MLDIDIAFSPTRDSPKKPRTNASTQRGASTPRGNRAYVLIPKYVALSDHLEHRSSAPMTPTTPTPVKKSRYINQSFTYNQNIY